MFRRLVGAPRHTSLARTTTWGSTTTATRSSATSLGRRLETTPTPGRVDVSSPDHHRPRDGSSGSEPALDARASSSSVLTPTPEHGEVRRLVRAFVRDEVEPGAKERDASERLDVGLLRRMGSELALLGPTVSSDVPGGGGLDATAAVIIAEELAYSDPGLALSHLAHAILFAHNLYKNGSAEQIEEYLPSALDGRAIGGMAMTEASAGTDVLAMKTRATDEGTHWRLDGSKCWITNGYLPADGEANDANVLGDRFLVYAKTTAAEDDTKADTGISLFLVERGFEGFSLGRPITGKLGMRCSPTAELVFDGCVVPKANLVGALHHGTVAMMRNLEIERLVLAAMATGIARRCVDAMRTYATERRAFGAPIAKLGQIQAHVADSYAECAAARAYVYAVANRLSADDADVDGTSGNNATNRRIDSDAVKLVASRAAKAAADRAIQTLGANGYVADFVVERLWRDAKLLEIGGGTLESHQKNITRDLARFHHDDLHLPDEW